MSDIKPGDVVRLKSSGPVMTVKRLAGEGNCHAVCSWFVNDLPKHEVFPVITLEKVEDETPDAMVIG